jgi:endonuclease/exonuclease/phosphatase family metal-dependent hydrolase
MKIITQNLEFFFGEGIHKYAGKTWEHTEEFVQARINHFAELFKAENADVIFLQELASEDVIKRIIDRCGIDYSYFLAKPDNHGIGNAILTKDKNTKFSSIPCVSPLPVFVTGDIDTIGPRIWSRRDFVYAETTFNDKPLHLLCIHIKANFLMPEQSTDGVSLPMETQITFADGLIRSELFRASQSKRARLLIDEIFRNDQDAQIIVAGDFNGNPTSTIFRIISGGIKELPDSLILTTTLIPKEERYSAIFRDENHLIDHILVSKTLEQSIKSVKILNKNLTDEKNTFPKPSRIESDHAPIILEIN